MEKPFIIAEVLEKRFISEDVFILRLLQPQIAKECQPGQFVNIKCSHLYDPLLRRPFSIFDANEEEISLLIRIIGKGTKSLSLVNKGDKLDALGPLGNRFPYEEFKNPLLVAGGMGIAPIHFLLKKIRSPTLVYGAKSRKELYIIDELENLCHLHIFTEDGSLGEKGFATIKLASFSQGHDAIFACGPLPMLKEIARIGREIDVPTYLSLEERMACGFGACLGCAIKTKEGYKMLCKDGPIMKGEEILF
ncbi:MAG: dihydroorotate dehydrogenase electron transfer subunit [bacterium]